MSKEISINLDRDGGPAFPVEVQSDGNGGLRGYQTSHVGGWQVGLSIRELAAIEFTKVHLADLMAAKCTEGTDSRIKEAVTRGWRTADEFIHAREVFMRDAL